MKVKFGIIGAGYIARRFGSVLKKAESDGEAMELFAVADINKAIAQDYAEKLSVGKVYYTTEDILSDPDVDIVYVGVTTAQHADVVRQALKAGKHVLCEKPMALSEAVALELKALAEEKHLFLMEGIWTLLRPAVQEAMGWIRESLIGNVRQIVAEFCFLAPYNPQQRLYNKALGGGSMYDVGVYCTFISNAIMNSAPKKITGVANLAPTGVDSNISFSMLYENGAIATGLCGFEAPMGNDCRIYGNEGSIVLKNFYDCERAERYDLEGHLVQAVEYPCENGFIYEARHVCNMLRKGNTQSDIIPLQASIDSSKAYDILMQEWGIEG